MIETTPLGTGGAVANAAILLNLKEDFLVVNADTWLGAGINEMISAASPSIMAVWTNDIGRYGSIQFNSELRVTAFLEKNGGHHEGWINAGICRLNGNIFLGWDGKPFSLEGSFYSSLISANTFRVVPLHTSFVDIGIPEDYARFCCWVESGRKAKL